MYFGIKYTIRSSYVFFPVKEIVFSGNKHLTGSELKVMMGLKGNESLIGLSGKVLAANLLKSPWVKAVGFRKDFPQRFQVRIEEAAPLALLEMNNRTFFIDDKGNLLEEIKSDSISFLPVISGDPFKNSSSFSEVLNLVKVIKGSNFINTKDRIEIIIPKGSGPEDISVRIDGILAKIGYGEYEAKLERLLELEDEIMRRGLPVDYIDLRFANRVIVKPINEVIR
ncbi:MAG: FtsQ-type POTRA domain-containing protein [Nitrospirae bacterium]|nr:FtsQ-type POTRA domain-containing protein [Nitrospirota bacterium]